jgi:hypothetical protein
MGTPILGNQLVVMSRADLDAMVKEAANKAAANSENNKNDENFPVSSEERFITRGEAAQMLHVDKGTLWRWNKQGILLAKKVGPRRVMYKYADVLARLNGSQQPERSGNVLTNKEIKTR